MTDNNNRPIANRIDAALNEVGESLRETIRLAEQRAEDAEAALDAMSRAFVDAKRPPAPVATIVKPTASKPSTKVFYPDSLFLNALTTTFQDARELHKKLRASGVSKGSIYARLQRLADDPASQVEVSNYNYRLKAPVALKPSQQPSKAAALRSARQRAIRGGRTKSGFTAEMNAHKEVSREFWSNGVRLVLTIG